jgi:hypothetical protein
MERAKRAPVATFLDFGYSRQNDAQGRDTDEMEVRLGVSLPLWSWLMNDAHKVPQEEARGYSRQIGRMHNNIEMDVISAIQGVRQAQSWLDRSEKELAALKVLMKNEGLGGAGFAKNPVEVESESEEMILRGNVERLQLHRLYNESVIELERALGTRLEKVLPLGGK